MSSSPCTLWFRYDRINGWEYNHLEDGHSNAEKPTPKFPSQSGWLRASWARYHYWLDAERKVVFFSPDED